MPAAGPAATGARGRQSWSSLLRTMRWADGLVSWRNSSESAIFICADEASADAGGARGSCMSRLTLIHNLEIRSALMAVQPVRGTGAVVGLAVACSPGCPRSLAPP